MCLFQRLFVLLAFLYLPLSAFAQSTGTTIIRIDTAGTMRGDRVGEVYIQYLSQNVELSHEGDKMYCDSCVLNPQNKSFKAYGNVSILQSDGSALSADYIYYNGIKRSTKAQGNVVLTDFPNQLWTDNLDYNLDSKIGSYSQGGVLQAEGTSLWSDRGIYNGKSHWSHFTKDVVVQGDDYYVSSDELKYNTETKDVIFVKKSTIYQGESVMTTRGGTYNSDTKFANFDTRTEVYNGEQSIEADRLQYDKQHGLAFAKGDVHIHDTSQHVYLFSDTAFYFDESRQSIAYGDPIMLRYGEEPKDSFFLIGDTLQSFDVISEINVFVDRDSTGEESITEDTVRVKNFIAWHHVKINSDSLQGIADSLYYSQLDSTLRLYQNPILWSDTRQMKADTIYAYMIGTSGLDSLKMFTKSSIISQPEHIADGLDQVLGNWISTYYQDNKLAKVHVLKNAQNILYITDDQDQYIGVYKSESNSVDAYFKENKLDSLKLYQDIDGKMYPMEGTDFKSLRFETTQVHTDKRPMQRDLFYDRVYRRKEK